MAVTMPEMRHPELLQVLLRLMVVQHLLLLLLLRVMRQLQRSLIAH